MAKANPLKKITAEAKRIRKQKPKTTWKSAVKQAGAKYRSGKIRAPKKKVGKVGAKRAKPRKKAAKRKSSARKKPVTTMVVRERVVRARRVGRSAPVKRHRMAGSGGKGGMKNLLTIGLLVLGGFLLWKALKKPATTLPPGTPPLYQTSNQLRNDQSNQILQYALAAGLTLDAITKLIQNLNSSRDSDVETIYDELDRGGELPATLYA
jgi:hypothetical protein